MLVPCPRYCKAEINEESRSDETTRDLYRNFLLANKNDNRLDEEWLSEVETAPKKSREDACHELPFVCKEGTLQKAKLSVFGVCSRQHAHKNVEGAMDLPFSHCSSRGLVAWFASNFESMACKSSVSRMPRCPWRKRLFSHQKKLRLTTPDEVSGILSPIEGFGTSSRISSIILKTKEEVNTAAIAHIERIQKVRTRAMSRMTVTARYPLMSLEGLMELICSTQIKEASATDSTRPSTDSVMAVLVGFDRDHNTTKAICAQA